MSGKKCILAGIGMGNPDMLTVRTLRALESAPLVAGEQRMLDALPPSVTGTRTCFEILEAIPGIFESYYSSAASGQDAGITCAVFSGDAGFYSGATSLIPLLERYGYAVNVLPGITTAQYLASKLCCPWHDWRIISGKTDIHSIGAEIGRSTDTLFLTGGSVTPALIIRYLSEHGAGSARVTVAEDLSYDTEKITTDSAVGLLRSIQQGDRTFSPLAAVLVERSLPCSRFGLEDMQQTCGFPDDFFVRNADGEKSIPMTRQEIRSVIMAKLALRDREIFYDVGAGTGAVSVEAALSCHCSVYAVEENAAACGLIKKNRAKAGASNIEIIRGSAPAAFAVLPPPDAVFIGGSHDDTGSNLTAIIRAVREKNQSARILISAADMETVAVAAALFADTAGGCRDPEVTELLVNRTRRAGHFHVFSAQNPVFLFSV